MNANRIRIVAVVIVIAAFIALATFALLARAYRPGQSGVRVPGALAGKSTTQFAQSAAAVTPTATVLGGLINGTPGASASSVEPAPAPATQAATAPAHSAPGSGTSTSPPNAKPLPPCPLGLAVPTQQAGVANLVQIVPLFGPFSPEAFAMVPAFEPAFPVFGPLITSGGKQLDAHAAEMGTVVGVVHPVEQQGFDTLSPLYGPYRQQFLAGEASVASAMAPGAAAFANAPGVSCVPAALSTAGVG